MKTEQPTATAREVHYVVFHCPGTFFDEAVTQPIETWDPAEACARAGAVEARYGARPYGFKFKTLLEHDPIPDGRGGELKVVARLERTSALHYLGGEVLRFDDLPAGKRILRSNMRCNNWPVVIENCNSYRHTGVFEPGDVVVDPKTGAVTRRGDDPDLAAYRAEFTRRLDAGEIQ